MLEILWNNWALFRMFVETKLCAWWCWSGSGYTADCTWLALGADHCIRHNIHFINRRNQNKLDSFLSFLRLNYFIVLALEIFLLNSEKRKHIIFKTKFCRLYSLNYKVILKWRHRHVLRSLYFKLRLLVWTITLVLWLYYFIVNFITENRMFTNKNTHIDA